MKVDVKRSQAKKKKQKVYYQQQNIVKNVKIKIKIKANTLKRNKDRNCDDDDDGDNKQVTDVRYELVGVRHNSHSQYSTEILQSHDLIGHQQIMTNILIALLKLFKLHVMFCCFILFCSLRRGALYSN